MKNKEEEILRLLGKECFRMYKRLDNYICDHYNVDQVWDDGGKYGDTVLRYSRSKKTLCTLYFRERQLRIWIIMGKDEREQLAGYWKTYYDFDNPIATLTCDGCLSKKADAKGIDMECPIRPCVIKKQLNDCSECESYPCEKFMSRKGISLTEASKIKEIDIPSYYNYLSAFDNKSRLDRKR